MPRPRFDKLDLQTRSRILETAAEGFADSGFEVSYNAIIERTGLSKGVMYYYFDDKEDLYLTLVCKALDVLNDLTYEIEGKRVVCVTSGGNFDFERLPEVKERAMRYQGLKKYFILRMPQRPGALKDFLNALGPKDDIARFEYLKKSARNFGSVLIGIETTSPDAFAQLTHRMDQLGFDHRDITTDPVLAEFLI